jgi:hypothetical protein
MLRQNEAGMLFDFVQAAFNISCWPRNGCAFIQWWIFHLGIYLITGSLSDGRLTGA